MLGTGAAGILAACGEPEVVIKEVEKVVTKEVIVEKIVTVPAPAGPMTGTILADGSSTVGPVTQAVAEEFRSQFPEVRVPVGISGSGAGFKKFCIGETDISNASRPIKASEIETCQSNGIDFVEVPVAFDGLAVLANPANDFADCLTVDGAAEDLGAGRRGHDHELGAGARRLSGRTADPLWAGRGLRDLRLLHGRDRG